MWDLNSVSAFSTPTRFRHNCNQESRGQRQFANELSLRRGFAAHYLLEQIEQLVELRQSVIIAGKQLNPQRVRARVCDLQLSFEFLSQFRKTNMLLDRNRHSLVSLA